MLDELARTCDDVLARARSRADALSEAGEALAAVCGEARSPDGDVRATVDGGGRLVALTLDERASGSPPERLAALIVETVQAAVREVSAQRLAVLGDLVADLGR
ncbi:YbaB/EbfC family nucleoid-associated protein [Mycolicibacterium monacense]|uniref:YbaB/EbfC family nucleoid-associated protein n=1 Tax=Mycolicibacterium monacense TaxID=85693 RepID=UPI0007EAF0E6|nr:YbaB/EbfC family nucleoid-associated protein [Mycolicibacterium monacense]OBF47062.1 hypothetical protein A5778_26425 [Mycolicibacterium monacense]